MILNNWISILITCWMWMLIILFLYLLAITISLLPDEFHELYRETFVVLLKAGLLVYNHIYMYIVISFSMQNVVCFSMTVFQIHYQHSKSISYVTCTIYIFSSEFWNSTSYQHRNSTIKNHSILFNMSTFQHFLY